MRLKFKKNNGIWPGAIGLLLAMGVGLFALHFNYRPGKFLQSASFDWAFELSPLPPKRPTQPEVIIIYMDEESHRDLKQPLDEPWDRALHASLVDRLTDDDARAVVFDVVFIKQGPSPEADQLFENAIRRNRHVVLASDLYEKQASWTGGPIPAQSWIMRPYDPFLKAAGDSGWNQVTPSEDMVVREHFHGQRENDDVSLSWATARMLGLEITRQPRERLKERWVKYYGGNQAIPYVSYQQARSMPAGFFRNKVVFIGERPSAGSAGERRDEFRSPFSPWSNVARFMPGVEIHATMLLNLMAQDSARRLAQVWEWAILYVVSIVFGIGLGLFPMNRAWLAALGGGCLVMVAALASVSLGNIWFPWLVIEVQIFVAWIWAVTWKSLAWYSEKRKLEFERKRAEARIRKQAALLDKAQDAIIVQELLGHITYWNKSAERLYGWTEFEVVDRDREPPMMKKEDPKIAEAHRALAEKGEWIGELRHLTKDAKEIIVESRWTLVRDETQKATSILMINTDVTERKKLEAQFLRNQRMESIGTLAGGIAHDLNNVLAPIVMGVEIMAMKERNPDSLRMLKMLGGSAKRGSDMVKQVLSFARGQEGEMSLLQIAHLIKEMDKILQETFPKSITFKTELMETLNPVMGDATQIHQVLLNLCVNGRDAMPDGGTLTIRARNVVIQDPVPAMMNPAKPGSYVELSVTDTGTGIPAAVVDRIFEPFFTTKEVGKGTGLGLSTVVSIIKGHGGVLDLKTEVGKGTTFIVYFPHAQNITSTSTASVAAEHLVGDGELVLVVDDEDNIRDVTAATLKHQGYDVLTARNGQQAVDLFRQHSNRIVVTIIDMMMPVMNGATAIRLMKEVKADAQIIATSGLLEFDKIKQETGVSDLRFLVKPFGAESILLAVHNAIDDIRKAAPGPHQKPVAKTVSPPETCERP